jgi:hypothetical protein
MKTGKFYLFIFILILGSCRPASKTDDKAILNALVKRYPDFYPQKRIEGYNLNREFYNYHDSLKMRLYDEENSGNRIVVLTNKQGKSYAIPFPDNKESSYWRFYGEPTDDAPNGKNFDAEMHNAYQFLSLDERWGAGRIFSDLAFSLLQAWPVVKVDTSNRKLSGIQNTDSCNTVAGKNFKAIYDGARESSWEYLNTFADPIHGRYYQFSSDMPYTGKKGFHITVYRQPCWVQPLYL